MSRRDTCYLFKNALCQGSLAGQESVYLGGLFKTETFTLPLRGMRFGILGFFYGT